MSQTERPYLAEKCYLERNNLEAAYSTVTVPVHIKKNPVTSLLITAKCTVVPEPPG